MVPNKGASLEHPVFMMRLGAKFVFRINLMAGSRRGGVPLGLTGPVKMRIGFARSDEGDSLEVPLYSNMLCIENILTGYYVDTLNHCC